MKTNCTNTVPKTRLLAAKLILLAASNYLTSCAQNAQEIETQYLDQLTEADRAELEAWLNGPIERVNK